MVWPLIASARRGKAVIVERCEQQPRSTSSPAWEAVAVGTGRISELHRWKFGRYGPKILCFKKTCKFLLSRKLLG